MSAGLWVTVWVIVSAAGTLVAYGLLSDARTDAVRIVEREVSEGPKVIVRARVRAAKTRLFVLTTWLATGLLALAPHVGVRPYPVTTWLVRVGLVAAAAVYVWDGFREAKVRDELLRPADEQE